MASKEDLEHFKQFIENYKRMKAVGKAGEKWKEWQLRRYESYLRRGEVPPELLKVWHRKPEPVYKPKTPVQERLIPSARLRRDTAVVHGDIKIMRAKHNLKSEIPVLEPIKPKEAKAMVVKQTPHMRFGWKAVLIALGVLALLKVLRR